VGFANRVQHFSVQHFSWRPDVVMQSVFRPVVKGIFAVFSVNTNQKVSHYLQ
jgi:hypothetical protein